MARIAVLYGTGEGQTARISDHVARTVRDLGHEAAVAEAGDLTGDLDAYDGVIVGSSIHMGDHERHAKEFAKSHREALEGLPSAFFSVSLTARDHTEEAKAKTREYVERFVEETGWRPDMVGIFAGALRYSQYGFLKRRMMRRISRDMGNPDTDTSRDYEYTDWNDVTHFAEEFVEGVIRQDARTAQE